LRFGVLKQYLKNYDWRGLKKYTKPAAMNDFNAFLEKMPQHSGHTMLIIAGVVWGCAGAAGIYTTLQLQQLTKLRADLQSATALKPKVPEIKEVAIDTTEVENFVEKIKETYTGLSLGTNGASIEVKGAATAAFGQFREAIGHVQNGGSGWRVSFESLCVGRECDKGPLSAVLKVNKVSVN